MTSQPSLRLTRPTAILVIVAGLLAAVVAALVAHSNAYRDQVAKGSVSLAFLTRDGSIYFLTPMIADFQTFMKSAVIAEAVAGEVGGSVGKFTTDYSEGGANVQVMYAAPTAEAADRGLEVGVRAALLQIGEDVVQRAEVGTSATKRQYEQARSALSEALRGDAPQLDSEIAREAVTRAQGDYLDAQRSLAEAEAAMDTIKTGDVITELGTASASPTSAMIRSAVTAAIGGALVALLAVYAVASLRARRGQAGGAARRAIRGGHASAFDSTYWGETGGSGAERVPPTPTPSPITSGSDDPGTARVGGHREPEQPAPSGVTTSHLSKQRTTRQSTTPSVPAPHGPFTEPGGAHTAELGAVTDLPPAFDAGAASTSRPGSWPAASQRSTSGTNGHTSTPPEEYDFFAAQRQLLDRPGGGTGTSTGTGTGIFGQARPSRSGDPFGAASGLGTGSSWAASVSGPGRTTGSNGTGSAGVRPSDTRPDGVGTEGHAADEDSDQT